MATMWAKFVAVNLLIIQLAGLAYSDYIVTHKPEYLGFLQKANAISTSEIPHVISSTFGLPLAKDISWNGLLQGSLFKRPKANVVISVEGGQGPLQDMEHAAKYSTLEDEPTLDTESVVNNIQSAAAESEPLLVDFSVDNTVFDIQSHHPVLFKDLPSTFESLHRVFGGPNKPFSLAQLGSLNVSKEVDLLLLGEIHVIRQIINALKTQQSIVHQNSPSFFHFRVMGLKKLQEAYGEDAAQVKDAAALLKDAIAQITKELRELFADNVVVQVVTSRGSAKGQVRKTRSLMADSSVSSTKDLEKALGVAADYDPMYPVVFNIILWGGIILALTVFAISWGIWFMDPGRDSIIYRMTSQRIKKE